MADSNMTRIEKILLLVWLVLSLVIGLLTVHDYGMSVDEPNNQHYALDALDAYPSFFGLLYEPTYYSTYDGHGPAFMTLGLLFVRFVQSFLPNLFEPDIWHFAYFLTFLFTGPCLYWLTRRWTSAWAAWGVLLLFSTQPLLRGHAFMNPKDIPFLFFLTLSVTLGLHMADSIKAEEPFVSLEQPVRRLMERFRESDPGRRRRFGIAFNVAVVIALILIVFSQQVNSSIETAVLFLYNAEPGTWVGRIFTAVASSNVPAEDYVSKSWRLFDRVERGLLAAGLLFFLVCFGMLIQNTTLKAALLDMWTQKYKAREWIAGKATILRETGSIRSWLVEFFQALRNPRVLMAGVALGLATGVRAIGPVAGVIVFLYLLAKVRSRAWAIGVAYFIVSAIATYIAWPRLWDAPIQRYLEALGVVSNFQTFPGRVLFNGHLYGASDLPLSYLPVLLNIQLTEPLLFCVYAGIGMLTWQLLHNRVRTDLLLYLGLGFVVPFVGMILLNSPLYHNFRQALFLVPPLVVIAGFALDWVFHKVTQIWIRVLLLAILAAPGVYSTVRLFPYEYVYYNSLVGGPAGATTRYELDYWRISLREMALELNEVARPGATIVVTRSAGLFARYSRPDLIVDKPINSILDLSHGYDYIIQVARGKGGDMYPEVSELFIIERAGAVLATAKDVKEASGK